MLANSTELFADEDTNERDAAVQHWTQAFRSRTASLTDCVPSTRKASTFIRRWDDEIESLTRQLLAAKQHRNAHTLPYLLPAEVLEIIFEHLADMDPINTSVRGWGWAQVTHVCRAFRIVALQHGNLWSDWDVSGDSVLWDLLLSRSRSAPLTIHGDMKRDPDTISFQLKKISEHISRIRILDITANIPISPDKDHDLDQWRQILEADVFELHTLRLSFDGLYNEFAKAKLTLGNGFLQSAASSLTSLCLSGIQMAWSTIPFPNLRKISLQNTNDFTPRSADVIQSLQCMPVLEILHLCYALPAEAVDSHVPIALPCLRVLHLEDTDKHCLLLWSCLVLTPKCSVYVDMVNFEQDNEGRLSNLVQGHFSLPNRPTYRHACVGNDMTWSSFLRFSVHSSDKTIKETSRGSIDHRYNVGQDPVLSIACQGRDRAEMLPRLLALLPSESIETLELLDGVAVRLQLEQILRLLPCVAELDVNSQDAPKESLAEAFCDLLVCDRTSQTDARELSAEHQHVLPRLRKLRLGGFRLAHCSTYTGRKLHDELTEAFNRRREDGLDNPIVNFTRSQFKESWLKAMGVEFTCDIISCRTLEEDDLSDDEWLNE